MVSDILKVKIKVDASDLERAIKKSITSPYGAVGGVKEATKGAGMEAAGGVMAKGGEALGKAGVFGLLLGGVMKIGDLIGGVLGYFSEISPAFKAMLKLFQTAVGMFLMPIANFFASLFTPLAIWLLKFAIDFNKTISPLLQELAKKIKEFFGGLGTGVQQLLSGDWNGLIKGILDSIKGAFDIGAWLLINFGNFITKSTFDLAKWLVENIGGFFAKTTFDFVAWIKDKLLEIMGLKKVGEPATPETITKGAQQFAKNPIGTVFGGMVDFLTGGQFSKAFEQPKPVATPGISYPEKEKLYSPMPSETTKSVEDYTQKVTNAGDKQDWFTGVFNTFISAITGNRVKITTLSSDIADIGKKADESKTKVDNLSSSIKNIPALPSFGGIGGTIGNVVNSMFSKGITTW